MTSQPSVIPPDTKQVPQRTQAERSATSESALLRAAGELIAERGIENTTLARIGERAGISRSLASYHFGSKNALIDRLARRAQDRIAEATAAAFEEQNRSVVDASALEQVRTMVGAYLRLFIHPSAEDRALVVLWGAGFPTMAAVEGMVEADRRSYDGWSSTIRRGQLDGSIRNDLDPAATAVFLLGVTRGIAALLATGADLTDMRHVQDTTDALISAALAPIRPTRQDA